MRKRPAAVSTLSPAPVVSILSIGLSQLGLHRSEIHAEQAQACICSCFESNREESFPCGCFSREKQRTSVEVCFSRRRRRSAIEFGGATKACRWVYLTAPSHGRGTRSSGDTTGDRKCETNETVTPSRKNIACSVPPPHGMHFRGATC